MPQVGNKKFPYTPSGIKQAANARRQKIAGAMDKVYRPDRDGPKRVTQNLPMPRPGRPPMGLMPGRPSGGVKPGRPNTKPIRRPFPPFGKRPGGGRVPVRPGRGPIRPGRGALAPRPWRPGKPGRGPLGVGRPKPPNRRYL